MPLTKIKRGGLDTGITDNSDANALTFDSSENATFVGSIDAKSLDINAGTTNTTTVLIERNYSGDAGSYLLDVRAGANETQNPALYVLQSGSGPAAQFMGKVGIGALPTMNLESYASDNSAYSASQGWGSVTGAGIGIHNANNTTNATSNLVFYVGGAGSNQSRIAHIKTAASSSALAFITQNPSSGSTEAMRLAASQNAIFKGHIEVSGTVNPTITLDAPSGERPIINFNSGSATEGHIAFKQGSATKSYIQGGATGNESITFFTGGTTQALKLDASQNATFAGTIQSESITMSNNEALKGKETGGTAKQLIGMTNSNAILVAGENHAVSTGTGVWTFGGAVIQSMSNPYTKMIDTSSGGDDYGLNNNGSKFSIYNWTDSREELYFGGDGNATFAGSVTTGDDIFLTKNANETLEFRITNDDTITSMGASSDGYSYLTYENYMSLVNWDGSTWTQTGKLGTNYLELDKPDKSNPTTINLNNKGQSSNHSDSYVTSVINFGQYHSGNNHTSAKIEAYRDQISSGSGSAASLRFFTKYSTGDWNTATQMNFDGNWIFGKKVGMGDAGITSSFEFPVNIDINSSTTQQCGLEIRQHTSGNDARFRFKNADDKYVRVGMASNGDFFIEPFDGSYNKRFTMDNDGVTTISTNKASGYGLFVNNSNSGGYGLRIAGGASSADYLIRGQTEGGVDKFIVKSDGRLGINEGNPGHPLHILFDGEVAFAGDTDLNGESVIYLQGTSADNEAVMIRWANHGAMNNYFGVHQVGASGPGDFVWTGYDGSSYNERLRLKANGNLIAKQLNQTGTTSNRYPLYWVYTGTDGSIEPYTGSVRAMKKDIADMGSVDWINSLRPRSFKFRDFEDIDGVRTYKDTTNDNPITEYGLIAEEVDEVEGSDYIVDKNSDGEIKGVLYHNLVPILLKALQEQNERIKALENA